MAIQMQESQIEAIIQQVMAQLSGNGRGELPWAAHYRGVFPAADAAVQAARAAAECFSHVSLMQRKAIVQAMREAMIENAQRLAQLAHEETGKGRVSDKVLKNLLCAEKTPGVEFLPTDAYVGDDGLTLEDYPQQTAYQHKQGELESNKHTTAYQSQARGGYIPR